MPRRTERTRIDPPRTAKAKKIKIQLFLAVPKKGEFKDIVVAMNCVVVGMGVASATTSNICLCFNAWIQKSIDPGKEEDTPDVGIVVEMLVIGLLFFSY